MYNNKGNINFYTPVSTSRNMKHSMRLQLKLKQEAAIIATIRLYSMMIMMMMMKLQNEIRKE